MMLTEGLNEIRDLLNTDINKGQFGTGSTAETFTDTALGTAVSDTAETPTASTASQFLQKTTTTSSVEGNSNTLAEVAMFRTTSSIMMSRAVFNGIAKTNTQEIRAKVRYFFE